MTNKFLECMMCGAIAMVMTAKGEPLCENCARINQEIIREKKYDKTNKRNC
jgi:hypothetical protein